MSIPIMKENEFSLVGKAVVVFCTLMLAVAALLNVWRGDALHPGFFVIAVVGFLLFLVAKVSVIARIRSASFGT